MIWREEMAERFAHLSKAAELQASTPETPQTPRRSRKRPKRLRRKRPIPSRRARFRFAPSPNKACASSRACRVHA